MCEGDESTSLLIGWLISHNKMRAVSDATIYKGRTQKAVENLCKQIAIENNEVVVVSQPLHIENAEDEVIT